MRRRQAFGFEGAAFFLQSDSSNSDEGYFGGQGMEENPQDMGRGRGRSRHRGRARGRYPHGNVRGGHQGQGQNLNQGNAPNLNQNQGNFPGVNLAQGHNVNANLPVFIPQGQDQQFNRGNAPNVNPGQFHQMNLVNVHAAGQGQIHAINAGQGQNVNLNQGDIPNINQGQYQHANQTQFVNQGNFPGANLAQGHYVHQGNVPYVHQDTGPRANRPVYYPQGQIQQLNRGNSQNANPGQFQQINPINVPAAGQGQVNAINPGQGQDQDQLANLANVPSISHGQGHRINRSNPPHIIPSLNQHLNPSNPPAIAQGQMNAFNPISISHGGQFHDVNQGYNPYGQVANFGNLSIASADQYVNMPHMLSVNTSQSQDVNRYPNENKGGSRCNDMGNSSNTHSGQEQPVNPRNVPTTSQGQNFHIQNVHPYHVQETDPNFFRTHDFLPRRGNHNILGLQHVAYGDGPANMPPGAQGLHNLGLNAPGVIRSISSEGSRDSRQEEGMGDDALGAAGGSPLNRGGGLIVGGENMGGPSYDFVNRGHRRNIYCNRGNRTDRSASVRGHSRPSFAAARTRRLSENADVKRKKSETASASSNKNDPSTSGRSDDTREISKDNKCTKNKAQATPAGDGDEDPAKSQRETVTSKTRGSDENSGNDSNNSGDDTSGGNEGSNESDNSNDNKSDQSGWVRDGARGDRARRSGGNKSSKISGKVRNIATDGSHVIDGSASSGGVGDSGVKSGSKGCGGSAVTGGNGGSDRSDSSGGKDGKGSNGGNGGSGSSGSGGSVGDNGGGSDGKGGNGGSGGNGSNGGNGGGGGGGCSGGGCGGGGGGGGCGGSGGGGSGSGGSGSRGSGGNGNSGGSGGCSGGSGSGGGGGRSGGNRNSGGSGSSGNSGSSGSGRSSGNGNRDDSGGATGEGDAVENRRECDNKSDGIADSMKSDKSSINDIASSGNDDDRRDRTGGQDESGDSSDRNGRSREGCDSTDSCHKNQQNSHSSSAAVAIGTGSNNSKGHSVGKGSKENLKDRSGNTVDNNKIDTVSDEGSSGSTRRLATGGTGESSPGIGDINTVEGKGNEGGTSNSKSAGDICDSKNNVTDEGGVFQDFSQEGNVARFHESDEASGDPHNHPNPPPFPGTSTDVHSNLTVPMDPNVLPAGFVLKTDPGVSNSEACIGSENTQSGLEEGNPNTASESGLVCDKAKSSSSSTEKTRPRFTYYNGMLINLDLAHMPADNFSNFSQANPFSKDVLTQMNIPPPIPESMVQSFNACVPTYPSIEKSQLLPSPQRGLYSLVNENTQYHIDPSARSMEPVQQYTIIGAPTYPSQIGAQFLPSSQSGHEHIQFTPGVGAEGQVFNVPLYPATNNTQILSLPQFGHQSLSNANIPSQFNVPPPGMENVLPSFNNVIPRHISSNNNPHFFTSPQSGSQLSATAEIQPHFNFGPPSAENAIKQFYNGVPLYQIAHNTQLPSSLEGNQQSPVSVPHTSFPNAMSSIGFNLAPSMKNVQPNLGNVLHPRLSKAIVNIDFNRPPIRPMNVSNRDIESNITINDNDTENSSTPSCITLPPRQAEESSETLATPETAVQTVVDKLVEQYGRPCVYHALSKNASDKNLPSLPTEVLQAIPGDPSNQRSVIMPPVTEAMSEPQPISTLEVPEITQIGSISGSCSTPQCSDQAGGVQQSEMYYAQSSLISSGDKHSLPAEESVSGCGAHSNIVGVNQYSSTLSPKKALYGSKPIPAGRGYGKALSPRKNRGGNRPIVSHAPTRFQEGKFNAHRGHNISDANVQIPIKEVSIADTHVALVCNDKGDGVSDSNVQLKSTDLAPNEDKTSDDSLVSVSKQVPENAEHSKEKERPQVKVSNVPSVGVKRFKESFPLKVRCDFKSDITFGSFDEDVSNQEKTENKGDKKRKEVCSKQDEESKIGGEDCVKENIELNLNYTKMLSEDHENSPIKGDKSSLIGDSDDSLHMSITKQIQLKEMPAIGCKEQQVVDIHKNKCTGSSVEKKCGKGTWGKDHSSGGEASKIYTTENQKTGVSTGFMSAPSEDFPALPSYGDRKKLVDSTTKASIPPRRPVGVGAYAKSNNRFFPYIEEKTGKDKINRKEHETNKDGYVDNMKRPKRPQLTLGGPYTNLLTVDTPSTCVGNDDSDLCVNFYLNLEHEFLGFISADSEDDHIPLQSDEDRNSGEWSEDESFDQFPLPSPSFHSDTHGDTITELASDGVHPEDKAPDSREENDSVARSLPFEGILQGNKDSIKELEQEQATHETGSAGLCESNLDLEKDNHHKHTAHLRNTLKLMTNKRDDDVGSGAANKGERLDAEDLNRLPQAAGFSGAGGLDRLRKFLAEHDVGGAGDEQNTVHGGEAGAVEDYLFRVSSSNPSNPS